MVDFEDAESSIADALGTDASYSGANGEAEVRGVFSHAHQRVESARGGPIGSRRPEFSVPASEFSFEPMQNDTITLDGVLYQVASVRPDEESTQYTFGLKRVS